MMDIDMYGDGDPVRYVSACAAEPIFKSYFTSDRSIRHTGHTIDGHYKHKLDKGSWSPYSAYGGKADPEVVSPFSLHNQHSKMLGSRTMSHNLMRRDELHKLSALENLDGKPSHITDVADHRMRDFSVRTARPHRAPLGIVSNFASEPGQLKVYSAAASAKNSFTSTRSGHSNELIPIGRGLGSVRTDARYDLQSNRTLRPGEGNISSDSHSGGDLHSWTTSSFPYASFRTSYVRGNDGAGYNGEPEAIITHR